MSFLGLWDKLSHGTLNFPFQIDCMASEAQDSHVSVPIGGTEESFAKGPTLRLQACTTGSGYVHVFQDSNSAHLSTEPSPRSS